MKTAKELDLRQLGKVLIFRDRLLLLYIDYRLLQSITEYHKVPQSISKYYKDKSSTSSWTNFWACSRKIACKSLMPENNVKVAAIYVKWMKGWARGIFKLLDADMKQYLYRKIKKT